MNEKQRKLKSAMMKAGFDMNKMVDFWGKRVSLGSAIGKMDSDDIQDAYGMIRQRKMGLKKVM